MNCRFVFGLSRSVQVESWYAQFSGYIKVKKVVVAHVNHLSWRDPADVAHFLKNVDRLLDLSKIGCRREDPFKEMCNVRFVNLKVYEFSPGVRHNDLS